MAVQNQGFRKDLNLEENTQDTQALNNLAGAGMADDLRIIQNNLRNTSKLSLNVALRAIDNGFFSFDPANEFVYTNDDVVTIDPAVTFSTTGSLQANKEYFICNSNGETKFKLSETSSDDSVGLTTVVLAGAGSTTNLDFIRKNPVNREQLVNFIKPESIDEDFSWDISVNGLFDTTQTRQEETEFYITKKYKGNVDTETDREIKFEGVVSSKDPDNLNTGTAGLSDPKSPGVFIGDTRAFSSNDQPWVESGSSLVTESSHVSIGELSFLGDIKIEGITPSTQTARPVTDWTHKFPMVIDGETYYILLTT